MLALPALVSYGISRTGSFLKDLRSGFLQAGSNFSVAELEDQSSRHILSDKHKAPTFEPVALLMGVASLCLEL